MAAAMERTAIRTGALRFRPFANLCRALFAMTDGDHAKAEAEAEAAAATCRETGFAFIGPWMLGLLAYVTTEPNL